LIDNAHKILYVPRLLGLHVSAAGNAFHSLLAGRMALWLILKTCNIKKYSL